MNQQFQTSVFVIHCDPIIAAGIKTLLEDDPRFRVCLEEPDAVDACGPASVVVADRRLALDILAAQSAQNRRPPGRPRLLIVSHLDSEQDIRAAVAAGVEGYVLYECSAGELRNATACVSLGARYIAPPISERLADSLTHSSLTARENTVLDLVASGLCNKSIARELDISVGTVKSHVRSVLTKLSATSRVQAVYYAQTRGLIAPHHRPRHAIPRKAAPLTAVLGDERRAAVA